jgi:hypothetical protein
VRRLLTASSLLGGHLSSNPMVWGFAIRFAAGLPSPSAGRRWVGLLMAIFLAADAWLASVLAALGPALHGQLLFPQNVSPSAGC